MRVAPRWLSGGRRWATAAAVAVLAGFATFATTGCGAPGDRAGGGVPIDDDGGDDDPRPIHERIDLPSMAACGACHQQVAAEWAASLHRGAWLNQNVRSATHDFALEECRCCHSPMPVLENGLDVRPLFRDFNHDDGVHCLSCHGRSDGVAAARDVPDAPCRPHRDERLLRVEMCQPCHEPTHQAFAEYRTSIACSDGVRCVDCHMPEREDGSGRSHGPHGGMNAEFVQKALRWSCAIEGRELVVALQNRTGHKFPGEIPSRSFVLRVDLGDREPIRELLRKPWKREDRADNRLLPDERRVLRYALPDGVAPADVRVRLLFQSLPLVPEANAFVLGDWRGDR